MSAGGRSSPTMTSADGQPSEEEAKPDKAVEDLAATTSGLTVVEDKGAEGKAVEEVEAAAGESSSAVSMNPDAPIFQQKHVLMFSWSFWYDHPGKRVSQQNWSAFIKKLNTFHTVEDFWCLYNNIVPPSRLSPGSNFHLFKEGIEPKWEDPCNERGGKWILAMPRAYRETRLDDFWLRTVLSTIGENFMHSEEVCGCVISMRKSQDKIAVWTTDAENTEAILSIGQQMREFLEVPEDLSLGYQVHTDSIKRNSSYNNRNRFEL